jgi:RND family efflux transporter MFP subunit
MIVRRVFPGLLAAVCLAACGCRARPDPSEAADVEHLPRVETVRAERGLLAVNIEVTASVEALEKSDLCARVPGIIETYQFDPSQPPVDIGRRVTKGEPLVRLSVPDLEADKKLKESLREQAENVKRQTIEAEKVADKEVQEAREQLKRYEAEYTQRKIKHDRTETLVKTGALQPETAEETLSQLKAAESALGVARAQIQTKQAKQAAAGADRAVAESKLRVAEAELQRLAVSLDFATIKAPFDGVITKRWMDLGAMIKDPGAPILSVERTDQVRVLVDISERDVPYIHPAEQSRGQGGKRNRVTVHIPALVNTVPGGEFTGTITRMADALDMSTRTMRAEIVLPNPNGHLRPRMTGTATVLLDERYDVLTIPSTALIRNGKNVEIVVVDGAAGKPLVGVARRRAVRLGLDDGKRVEIRTALSGNELIIAKGNGVVHAGDRVIAVESRELGARKQVGTEN